MFKACIFDAFGTLFNLDPLMLEGIDSPHKNEILRHARVKQLEYTWIKSLMAKYIPFDEITQIAIRDGCRRYHTSTEQLDDFGALYFHPTIYDDVISSLEALLKVHQTIGILSNGTPEMLQSGMHKNSLDPYIDRVWSADQVKEYKPSPRVYKLVSADINCSPSDILFVSSNQWDVAGALHFGFSVAWVNRDGLFKEHIIDREEVKEVSQLMEVLQFFV